MFDAVEIQELFWHLNNWHLTYYDPVVIYSKIQNRSSTAPQATPKDWFLIQQVNAQYSFNHLWMCPKSGIQHLMAYGTQISRCWPTIIK